LGISRCPFKTSFSTFGQYADRSAGFLPVEKILCQAIGQSKKPGTNSKQIQPDKSGIGELEVKRLFLTAIAAMALFLSVQPTWAQLSETSFNLAVNPKFVDCLGVPFGPQPTASVTVQRGNLSDVLILTAHHLKPNLAFDLFTTQNTSLLANGQPDPNFKNFGLAWYQTDVEADSNGDAEVAIKTVLLDQIFGFDPAAALPPTNTFHVGFWFNNPKDAVACGFNPNQPTPFNGEHRAGPNAMMSVPDNQTNLGPLCTNPELHGSTFVCHP
jgi:hypothetical protein